jgi:hypothetical protein
MAVLSFYPTSTELERHGFRLPLCIDMALQIKHHDERETAQGCRERSRIKAICCKTLPFCYTQSGNANPLLFLNLVCSESL